jgi:E3 SUMO-protein ligase PIAS1
VTVSLIAVINYDRSGLCCEVMPHHRNTVDLTVRTADHPLLGEILQGASRYRVLVFCAGENTPAKQDVSFPYQSEVRVNGEDLKASLRGLKNKPGSTRPVDITNKLRLRPISYENKVSLSYALSTKVSSVRLDITCTLRPLNSKDHN